jgi:hypothetical protein
MRVYKYSFKKGHIKIGFVLMLYPIQRFRMQESSLSSAAAEILIKHIMRSLKSHKLAC